MENFKQTAKKDLLTGKKIKKVTQNTLHYLIYVV